MPEPSNAWLRTNIDLEQLRGGLRGLERETLRVDKNGHIALTPHPVALGSALTHPYLTTDYSEALLEFVTPPHTSNEQALRDLTELHAFVQHRLDGELLWPASMPCIDDSDDAVPIAQYGSSNEGRFRTVYRRGLGYRYGRSMQAIAGVHFNYSPPVSVWPELREAAGSDRSLGELRSDVLMGLVRNYRRLAWIVAYLFGASPAIAKSFRPAGHARLASLDGETWYAPHATSLRMSDLGYRNSTQTRLRISANSPRQYVEELRAAVSTVDPHYASIGVEVDGQYRQLNANVLQIENEYYSSIRPKPARRRIRPVTALAADGVEYVEVRNLDCNPLSATGIDHRQMCVAEVLILHCLLSDSPPINETEQVEIDRRELAVAWEGRRAGLTVERGGQPVTLRAWGSELADAFDAIAEGLGGGDYGDAAAWIRAAFDGTEPLPSAVMLDALMQGKISLREYGLELARQHERKLLELDLAGDRRRTLEAAAVRSLEEHNRLEAQTRTSFAEYLQDYFGR